MNTSAIIVALRAKRYVDWQSATNLDMQVEPGKLINNKKYNRYDMVCNLINGAAGSVINMNNITATKDEWDELFTAPSLVHGHADHSFLWWCNKLLHQAAIDLFPGYEEMDELSGDLPDMLLGRVRQFAVDLVHTPQSAFMDWTVARVAAVDVLGDHTENPQLVVPPPPPAIAVASKEGDKEPYPNSEYFVKGMLKVTEKFDPDMRLVDGQNIESAATIVFVKRALYGHRFGLRPGDRFA